MAFVIPNATQTATAAPYVTLDQSEPDSLDFEILGNVGRSGVISGCSVTFSSGTQVAAASGELLVNGAYYVTPAAVITLPAGPTDKRFDLVVARVSSGAVSLVIVSGNDDATNFEFPTSKSVDPSSGTVDLSTDVVLASVFRQGSLPITAGNIVDKRSLLTSTVVGQGTAEPLSTSGSTGSLYFKRNVSVGTTSSGLYVKNSSGEWVELAQNIGPQVPVGGVIPWFSKGSIPDGWLVCDGSSVSSTNWPELAAALGVTGTFNLPDLREKHIRGTATANEVGTSVSGTTDSVTLSTNNMANHSHGLSHTHSISHQHQVTHDHSSKTTTGQGVGHEHNVSSQSGNVSVNVSVSGSGNGNTDEQGTHHHNFAVPAGTTNFSGQIPGRMSNYNAFGGYYYVIPGFNSVSNFAGADAYMAVYPLGFLTSNAGAHDHSVNVDSVSASGGGTGTASNSIAVVAASNTDTSHSHSVDLDSISNPTTGARSINSINTVQNATGDPSVNNTGSVGNSSSFSVKPPALYARWLIRAKGSLDNSAFDSANVLSEAREEVVTVELVPSGTNLSNTDVAYYRLPWGATLNDARAHMNSGTVTNTTTITVTGSVAGTVTNSLVIDAGGSSSTASSTTTVIAASDLADEELLTFSISGADTSDQGPLVVTLYLSRDD